ncbi:hypothetical protein [uncultured Brevundimonas sp.]|uniref:hypothetical protein n=1 Tax=uncultured Brevundimonas sp. TaxID=213418 RepID=UPI0025E981ED|nr:hypothetical protein [uncultured Brevundimonas sp.]
MGKFDLSTTALRLQQIDEAEDTADSIDDMVAAALDLKPRNASDCIVLIDLIVTGLKRDQQPRLDRADLRALAGIRTYLETRCQ